MSERFDHRARVSFVAASARLDETGRVMQRWAPRAAELIAPDLVWTATVARDGAIEGPNRWGHALHVELSGVDAGRRARGRGEIRLIAGGSDKRVGGSGTIQLETVGPFRALRVDNHCDVTHWDLRVAPLGDAQFELLVSALEAAVAQTAQVAGHRRTSIEHGARILVPRASADDAAVWIDDLRSVGIAARGQAANGAVSLIVESAPLSDLEALREARVVLGEILSEAGFDDWDERANAALLALPSEP